MNLMITISKEKKNVFGLGDFSVNLLKHDKHAGRNEFLDSLTSFMFLSYILHPTRVPGHSQTILDNIFSNYISKETVCSNLNSTISDHLPQVLFIPSMSLETLATKSNTLERSWTNFNQAEFAMDYFHKDGSHDMQWGTDPPTKIPQKLEPPVLKTFHPLPSVLELEKVNLMQKLIQHN